MALEWSQHSFHCKSKEFFFKCSVAANSTVFFGFGQNLNYVETLWLSMLLAKKKIRIEWAQGYMSIFQTFNGTSSTFFVNGDAYILSYRLHTYLGLNSNGSPY